MQKGGLIFVSFPAPGLQQRSLVRLFVAKSFLKPIKVIITCKILQRQKTSSVRLIEDYRCLTIGAQAIRHLIINVLNLHIYCLSYNNLHSTNSQRTYRYSREEESYLIGYVWLCMPMYYYVWLCLTMYDYVWLYVTM